MLPMLMLYRTKALLSTMLFITCKIYIEKILMTHYDSFICVLVSIFVVRK